MSGRGTGTRASRTLVVSERVATMAAPVMQYAAGGVLVENAWITAVLTAPEAARLRESGSVYVVDAGSQPVLPGFIDSHVHLEAFSEAVGRAVDCHSPPCRSIADVLQTLSDNRAVAERNDGWLIGQGSLFQDRRLADGRLPTRAELDSVDPTLPIVFRPGGHTLVMNTAALARAMEKPEFANLPAPLLERDAHGAVTGVLREVELAAGSLPIPEPGPGRRRDMLRDAIRDYFTARGVTSVLDMSGSLEGLHAIDDLLGAEEIAIRCSSYPIVPRACDLAAGLHLPRSQTFSSSSDWLAVRGLKFFLDGGISSGLAAVHQHYTYKESRGRLNLGRPALEKLVRAADDAGLDLAFHTMGERAQELLCDVVLAARPSIRVRAEHAGTIVTRADTFRRWREAGVVPMPNSVFIYTLADFIPPSLRIDRRKLRVLPLRSMRTEGWPIAGSSDAAGSEILHANPFFGMHAALTRQTYAGEIVHADESLSMAESLHGYTAGSAQACGGLKEKGTLEPGKLADLIVLEADPLSTPAADIPEIRAELVMVGGRIVLDRRPQTAAATSGS